MNLIKWSALMVLGFWCVNVMALQDTVKIAIGDIDLSESLELREVCVTAENFDGLVSFSYTIAWDKKHFQLDDITGMHPDLNIEFNMDMVEEGRLPVLWFDSKLDGKTLMAHDTLMCMQFSILEEPCSGELIRFDDEPTRVTFLDFDRELPYRIQPGAVHNGLCLETSLDILDPDSYQVFPNPSFGQVRVRAKQRIERIELYTLTGQRVAQFGGTNTFYFGGTGMFLVQVHTRKGVGQRRLVLR